MSPRREPLPTGHALRLTVYLSEHDRYHRHPMYHEIVRRAHDAGLAGAAVLRGIEGFGGSSQIHTTRLLDLAEDLPLAVIIVDEEQRIRDFLPQVREIMTRGLITLDDVEVVAHLTGEEG
ncbi:DUF190 domain-containing protein [Phaeacidiphilus oryzae]|uniref:DUF190 domain-containing protein n=1 Tax=Phaeacidiphilus oryzae TaxID=348818 RepID=UPI00055F6A40|nr:DUF190 domain-containing protein [Phaeacidiphilus oryzae]